MRSPTSMPSRRIVRAKKLFEGRRALAVVGGACVVFFGLGAMVRYSILQRLDLVVTKELQERNLPSLEPAMVGLTYAGEPVVVPVLGVIAAAALTSVGLPRAGKMVLLSLLSVPANIVLKTFWDRARPDADIVNVAVETAGTSFPSGHAMGATAFYGALAALAWIHLDPRRTRRPLTILFILLPVGVGISRIYLGAHWLSDVVAGSALGLFILIPLVRRYLRSIPAEVEDQAAAKKGMLLGPNLSLSS
ncbi:phosphatase PAP2 family protein [bacterium]|nr:MAG: phosphatase PAP2 family protein [bacterium]